jgi:hypothetical protein
VELPLPLDERECPQILSIQVKQIERDEYTGGFSEEQVLEDRTAFSVNARDLPTEHGVLNLQVFRDPSSEFGESPKDVSIAGN